jgi:hypothetical protein
VRIAVTPEKRIIDRSAQEIRAGLMQWDALRVGEGEGLQEIADELFHGSHLELGLKKNTITRRRPIGP